MYLSADLHEPCPFCGAEKAHLRDGPPYWVTCDECDADGPMTNESPSKAIELWDKRSKR